MADGSSGSPLSAVRRDTLALRLTLGFLGVALAAVALLAGLTAIFAANDVANLVNSQRTELTNAVAAAAGAAWDKNFTWRHADLNPALEFASRTGADAQIRDLDGNIVGSSRGFADQMGRPTFTAPVIVSRGTPEGRAIVRFGSSGLNSADNALVVALLRALGTAAGIVALVALVTALGISRRLARPVAHIIAVTRAMGSGRRDARVGSISAPSELRELATAFDQMADKLDRNEQLRRDLVADVAHELRTPVAVLQAGHEALLDGVAEPTPDELVSLRDEVLRLARMVGDLQTLSAADAAALHLVRRRRDLAAIAAAAADSLAPRFEAAGTVLERRLAPVEVLADERWLHQLITNLLTNALKYSPTESHVIIDVRPDGQDAVLRVIDAGIGIPAADLPHIFDRFWRGKQALDTSGSGIGLAIAFELATAHGGTLNAVSDPGEGTQMTLTLPRALAWRPLRKLRALRFAALPPASCAPGAPRPRADGAAWPPQSCGWRRWPGSLPRSQSPSRSWSRPPPEELARGSWRGSLSRRRPLQPLTGLRLGQHSRHDSPNPGAGTDKRSSRVDSTPGLFGNLSHPSALSAYGQPRLWNDDDLGVCLPWLATRGYAQTTLLR